MKTKLLFIVFKTYSNVSQEDADSRQKDQILENIFFSNLSSWISKDSQKPLKKSVVHKFTFPTCELCGHINKKLSRP